MSPSRMLVKTPWGVPWQKEENTKQVSALKTMLCAVHTLYKTNSCFWRDLVGFYGISTIVGYLMPNPFYTYILNIYDLVWLGFMAYQPL